MGIGYFIFGNVDSRNYDITVAFKDVDHTPKRVYQRIAIPGRNGEFYLDEKRFEDVPVSYDCIALDDDDRKSFVNALAAQTGHVRLEDTFNVGEFYSAVFEGDVDPYVTQDRENSTFTIQFTRKPQRWLKSGETAVSVSSGGTLTNPTLFEASPIIKVEGYGTISTGGQSIDVESVPVGNVFLSNGATNSEVYPNSTNHYIAEVAKLNLDLNDLNTGDSFVLAPTTFTYDYTTGDTGNSFTVATATNQVSPGSTTASIINQKTAIFRTTFEPLTFVKGTARTVNHTYDKHWEMSGGSTLSASETIRVFYNGSNTIRLMASEGESGGLNYTATGIGQLGSVSGYSTLTVTSEITIDLDIGEAYWENNGSVASANFAVSLGSELMKLKAGANTIAYSNTFTSCKIIPRWWKV